MRHRPTLASLPVGGAGSAVLGSDGVYTRAAVAASASLGVTRAVAIRAWVTNALRHVGSVLRPHMVGRSRLPVLAPIITTVCCAQVRLSYARVNRGARVYPARLTSPVSNRRDRLTVRCL
jgi:hypothetical protein